MLKIKNLNKKIRLVVMQEVEEFLFTTKKSQEEAQQVSWTNQFSMNTNFLEDLMWENLEPESCEMSWSAQLTCCKRYLVTKTFFVFLS